MSAPPEQTLGLARLGRLRIRVSWRAALGKRSSSRSAHSVAQGLSLHLPTGDGSGESSGTPSPSTRSPAASNRSPAGSSRSPAASVCLSHSPLHRDATIAPTELEAEAPLGHGAFGEVTKALWRGTPVAVKRLNRHRASGQHVRAFRDEYELQLSLRHPNIVLLLGGCWAGDEVSLVLEYCEHGSLGRVLAEKTSYPLPWATQRLPIAVGIARALAYLHGAGICHRDLKPDVRPAASCPPSTPPIPSNPPTHPPPPTHTTTNNKKPTPIARSERPPRRQHDPQGVRLRHVT